MSSQSIQAGAYTGSVYGAWSLDPPLAEALADIRERLAEAGAISAGIRNAVARVTLPVGGVDQAFAVKSFPRESWLRDRYFAGSGSKARRSYTIAAHLDEHGVGTPRPLAYLERWERGRLLESYYLSCFSEGLTNFRDELNRLYRDDPLCRRIMTLMHAVAYAVADMHDAGVLHRDLGNQNIMLRRIDDDTWGDVQFIDLNRARISEVLTEKQRARDLSRIDLPSDFLRVFKCMYHRDQHPSDSFQAWERRYRSRFALHTATRAYRHPIRARREARGNTVDAVPRGRELWVWDDRSVQAVSTMVSRERRQYYPFGNHLKVARAVLDSLAPVHRRYRDYLERSFRSEVALGGRVGMAVGTKPGQEDKERPFLAGLGAVPVLLRLYRHEPDDVNARAVAEAVRLRKAGHPVFAALVQDRTALRRLETWVDFAEQWIPQLAGTADWLEVGHAVNRVKWGMWDVREYARLLDPVVRVAGASKIPFRLCGPAVIDFEYHYLAALLEQAGSTPVFDALSLHLYVDRRGAPENRQGSFAAVEKFALARAYADWSGAVRNDRIMISEVNWPLLDTGDYSPVCSPYVIPGSHTNDPSVDEDTYADYMLRYITLALCSGHVEAVYWWRLVARGFGLVDDAEAVWRPRPAYDALVHFVQLLGEAVFRERLPAGDGILAFRFTRGGGDDVVMAWAHPVSISYSPTFAFDAVLDRRGKEIGGGPASLTLSGSPVFFTGVR